MDDLRKLRPTDCRRLLNSYKEFGTVLNASQMTKLRDDGGLRVSSPDGKTIDLLMLCGFLVTEYIRRKHEPDKLTGYAKHKEKARQTSELQTRAAQELQRNTVTEADEPLLERSTRSLKEFCEIVYPERFSLAWSDDHLTVLEKAERAITQSGLFGVAMPRGNGKSAIVDAAAMWAALTGHRRYVVVIGATERAASKRLDSFKTALLNNEMIARLFPDAVDAIRAKDGGNRKQVRINGDLVHQEMSSDAIVLPVIDGASSSGAIFEVRGITGAIRGMDYSLPSGETVRPDLVLIDDPQTHESAKSALQCWEREQVIAGDILGLAGPDKMISGLMPMTIIRPGDLADRLFNPKEHPEWDSERFPLVYEWPECDRPGKDGVRPEGSLWQQYEEISKYGEGDRYERHKAATAHYEAHREPMDRGAVVAWSERFDRAVQVSALQYAYDWKIRDEAAFNAEAQQNPDSTDRYAQSLSTGDILAKCNRLPVGVLPFGTEKVTGFIDIQGDSLWWLALATRAGFAGAVVAYGVFPEQPGEMFHKGKLRPPLVPHLKAHSIEEALHKGLATMIERLMAREWPIDGTEGKSILRMSRLLIDANWEVSTNIVYEFCRQSAHAGIILPSHGRFVGASSQPFSEYKRRPGDRIGHNWRMPNVAGKRAVRHVVYDTNFWKTFIHARLAVPMGDRGCLSLFGDSAELHRLIAEHLSAEYRVKTEGRGRTVDEWKQRPERGDNHWLDGVVGCAVAASIQGAVLASAGGSMAPLKRERVRLSTLQRGRR